MSSPSLPEKSEPAAKSWRPIQIVLIASTIGASWFGMQAIHELGHVTGAWLTGGRLSRVVLHPLTISRTDLAENPHPLVVVWAGPVLGCLIPLLIWAVMVLGRFNHEFLLRFFAGFCLIANGAYIAVGSIDRVGDCGEMLKHGSAVWQLWLFGVLTIPPGFRLWHGLGPHFGLGPATHKVNGTATVISVTVLVALIILGLAVGGS